MRRSDREVSNIDDIAAIVEKCDVCRIALNNDGYPYILPLNFGMLLKGDRMELYFHGAMEGMKYELIEKDRRASFEMDCSHKLVAGIENEACTYSMEYESVIGRGYIEILPEREKHDALCILMKHYGKEDLVFNKAVMEKTKVFKLVVEKITGKTRRRKR